MSRILKTEPLPHIVICDTNMLWHEDKAPTVSPDFEAFWTAQSSQFDLSLVIPDVVKGELLFQHCTSCHKLLKSTEENLKKISAIAVAQHSIRLTPEKIRKQIEEKFNKWIRQHKATVLPIPAAKINWTNIANAAVWRLPPFEADAKNPDWEKGFRDALIMETICEFVQNDSRKINIAFLCNDQVLKTATVARLKTDSRFFAYETLKDFESYLNLTKQKFTNEFISKILTRARDRFYDDKDPSCLTTRSKLLDRLKSEYNPYFEDVSKSEQPNILAYGLGSINQPWNPVSSGTFWITSPEFLQIENEKTTIGKVLSTMSVITIELPVQAVGLRY